MFSFCQQHSKKVIHVFKDVFSWLPLATVVDDQILVCHGGISDSTDLELMATIDRHRVGQRKNVSVTDLQLCYL